MKNHGNRETQKADKIFSRLILGYPYAIPCAKCQTNAATDCSHFYERGNSSVRYNVQNCDPLCRGCHSHFHAHRDEYKMWKLHQLGSKDYMALQRLAATVVKREEAIAKFIKSIS